MKALYKRISFRIVLALLIGIFLIGLLPRLGRGAQPLIENWIPVQNGVQGYRFYRPPDTVANWFAPEGILHVEFPSSSQVLTVRVYDNPKGLSAKAWSDAYLLDPL